MNIDLGFDLEREQLLQDNIENELDNLFDIEENIHNPNYLPESELTNFMSKSLYIIFSKNNNSSPRFENDANMDNLDENKLQS